MKILKILYIFFAFCILIFGAMSFFMRKDILLIPTFIAFVGLSGVSAARSGLEGDKKTLLLFSGASVLFVVITLAVWNHMDLSFESFRHVF